MGAPAAAAATTAASSSAPAWLEAAGSAFSGAAQGAGSASSGKAQAKATKYSARKAAKEQKRKTLADLLNEALRREFEASQMGSKRQQEYRGEQARVLQNLASQYVQALR